MNTRTVWNERFGMLMASGNPGSALAYQLGRATSEPVLPRRNMATSENLEEVPAPGGPGGWLRRLFGRFEAWSYRREMREVETYLAQAQDHADLEVRMRLLRDDLLSRARTLR